MRSELQTVTATIQTTVLPDGTRITILADLAGRQKEVSVSPDLDITIEPIAPYGTEHE